MKLRPPSSRKNREFINNMGGGIFWTLGGKDFSILKLALGIVNGLVGVGSIGAKLYLRKSLGVRSVNVLMLALQILTVWAISAKAFIKELPPNPISTFAQTSPLVFYYLLGLLFLTFVHYTNVWFLKQGQGKHSYHRGFGILSLIGNGGEKQENLFRIIDPFLLAFGACFFLTFEGGKILAWTLWVGSICLLIEELQVYYLSWEAEMDLRDADLESRWLSEKHEEHLNGQASNNSKSNDQSYRARTAKD